MALKVLITGSEGQLGTELQRTAPADASVIALESVMLDVTDSSAVDRAMQEFLPNAVINAAAYTSVDLAEKEAQKAYAVNEDGVKFLAAAVASRGSRLLHVSTDFIFGGDQGRPYSPDDSPNPLSVYGTSKLAGEHQLRAQENLDWLIMRTGWLYSAHGNNFVKTMLRLMREGKALPVVADQIGSPTWARGLAGTLWRCLERGISGVHHWSDAGVASWYDFAVAIQEEALSLGLVETPAPITPISSVAYPTPARRPSYSVLDKTETWKALGLVAPHWRANLRLMLGELPLDR